MRTVLAENPPNSKREFRPIGSIAKEECTEKKRDNEEPQSRNTWIWGNNTGEPPPPNASTREIKRGRWETN